MKVICVSGKAGAGKDTFAGMLKRYLDSKKKNTAIIHYADLLKYICKQYLDWNGEKDETGRNLLQHVGTDIVRARFPDYWVNFVVDILNFFGSKWDYAVIPDCRFPNEITTLQQNGFNVIHARVFRNGNDILTPTQSQHPSETSLDTFKYHIKVNNNSDLESLSYTTAAVAELILGGQYDYIC